MEDINKLITCAESGDSAAQTNLGVCYMHGNGVERDTEKALSWYLKAAEQNEPSALTNAGECYMYGIGTGKNIEKAVTFLSKASEFDIPEAQSSLGAIYLTGDGVTADPERAVALFTRAAEQKLPEAFSNLGRCHLEGIGVEKNLAKALDCFDEARNYGAIDENRYRYICDKISINEIIELVANGNAQAQCFLGCMYLEGKYLEQNLNKAWELILEASRQGEPLALFLHGHLYYEQNNFFAAEIMLKNAVEAGSLDAPHYLAIAREKIAETGTYFLVKVTNKHWADKFLDGDVYMRCLGEFGIYGRFFSKDASVNNSFRGDLTEGLASSFGVPQKEHWIDGVYDSLLQRNKIFCLYSLDICKEHGWIAPIDQRIRDFGDTAVIILDSNEFLRRVHKAFSNRFGSTFWTSYKRVKYELDFTKNRSYTEFNKDISYAWQKEFRISLDLSEGRVPQKILEETTDFAKLQYLQYGKLEVDTNPDSIADFLVVNIGDIRDICLAIPTSDFIVKINKLIGEQYLPPTKIDTLDVPRKPYPTFFRPMFKFK